MISQIENRGIARGRGIWPSFENDPFRGSKIILFGLYAATYMHGLSYLSEITEERLLQIVSEFDLSMAKLSSDQQQTVKEIATKKYIDTIDRQIHEQQMETKRAELDSQNAEYDARFEALETDRIAILTKREQLSQVIQKAASDIKVLEARISEEEVERNYVEVDIAQKELDAAQTRMKVLQAGLRGLELQYDIANIAVQRADLRLDKKQTQQQVDLIPVEQKELEAAVQELEANIKRIETAKSMVDVDIAKTEVSTLRTQIDTQSRQTDTALLEVDLAKAELDTAMVEVEKLETEARTARELSEQAGLETDIAMVEVQIAQIQLDVEQVNVQLKEIAADKASLDARLMRKELLKIDQRIAETKKENMDYEISSKMEAQIDAIKKQIEVLEARISAEEKYLALESDLARSREDSQQAEHDYRMKMAELDDEYRLHRAQVRIDSYSKDILMAAYEKASQALEDQERIKEPQSSLQASRTQTRAAEEAAEIMASADIINTLSHVIGSM